MENELIAIEEYAEQSHTDVTFIVLLNDYGLIELTVQQETRYIAMQQLPVVEKFVRLHYDLQINIEGIEAIHYLLEKVQVLQQEVHQLKDNLRLYQPV